MFNYLYNNEINSSKWDEFVAQHPNGTVFQTFGMFNAYCHTSHYEPLAIAILDEGDIVGLILTVTIYNGNSFTRLFTARSIIIGGPLVKNNDSSLARELVQEYKKRLKAYIIYSEIRPIYDPQLITPAFLNSGFSRIGHYNLTLDVSQDVSALWDNLHKERKRNISKAESIGLVFKEVFDEESFQAILFLIQKTYQRKKVPLSNLDLFRQVQRFLPGNIHFFAAYYGDNIIAGQIRLCYGNLIYAWYTGSDNDFNNMRPNDYLMWNVIVWAHEKGYKIFDFGGGGEPGVPYGVRDYKLKYGCQLSDFGRFIYYQRPIVYKMAKKGMDLLGLKKR